MAVDQAMRKQIEQEKKGISTDLGDMVKFLAYTHDDGPDALEGCRSLARKMRKFRILDKGQLGL